ncbi:MAG TPA: NYN domain-containing protein [Candidatus Limnocylindrales bacterium]|nr:NYN domain-containing protein [Candidatus Limnocylindrales bacterium]
MTIIIDGYNFIGRSRKLRIEDPHCREKLFRKLTDYCRLRKKDVIVVFDGACLGPGVDKKRTYGRITILYSSGGLSADEEIVRLIRADKQKKQLLVVTSDHEVQNYAKSMGTQVTKSEEFERDIERVFAQNRGREERNRRLSNKEVQKWLEIFSQSPSDEGEVDFPSGEDVKSFPEESPPKREATAMQGSSIDESASPFQKKLPSVARKNKGVLQEERIQKLKKIKKKMPEKQTLDRVHVHLSELEIQEWLKIFKEK